MDFQILDTSEQFEVMATNGYFGFWTLAYSGFETLVANWKFEH